MICILAGDFNIDFITNTKLSREFCNILKCFNIVITSKEISRETDRSATCIDNICISDDINVNTSTIKTCISDHNAQLASINLTGSNRYKGPKYEMKRRLNTENIDLLKCRLRNETWKDVLEENNPDTAVEKFMSTLTYNLNVTCPRVRVRIKNGNKIKNFPLARHLKI